MRIPDECVGEWAGIVTDSGRVRRYPCTLKLDAAGGTVLYDQERGEGESKFIILTEAPLVLDEDYTGPCGGPARWKLALELTESGQLACVWTKGSRRCTATLDRIPVPA